MEAFIHKRPFEWTGEPEIVEKAKMSYGAFLEWAEQSKLEITHTELSLVSNVYNFGGTLDAAIKINGKRALGDWKTSNAIYQDYLIQLGGGYRILWEENFPDDPIVGGYHLLRFDKEHGDFVHRWWGELEDAKRQFILFREAYELDKKLKKRCK